MTRWDRHGRLVTIEEAQRFCDHTCIAQADFASEIFAAVYEAVRKKDNKKDNSQWAIYCALCTVFTAGRVQALREERRG